MRKIFGLSAFVALLFALCVSRALAGTTGTIVGAVRDPGGRPLAGVTVEAVSPSGSARAVTDARGFYALQALTPDTYTLSFQLAGFEPLGVPGVNVQQDLVSHADETLSKELRTIGTVRASGGGSLFKPYQGEDVYNVSGAQLNAATGGDNLHKTVYQYLDTVPGVTPIGGGFSSEPSIRGGNDVDNGYELDGIPITERITGFFTTNLTDLGISNVEVFTGGLGASNAGNGLGVINSVIKTGTNPGFANVSVGATSPDFTSYSRLEFGTATRDKKLSLYLGFDGSASQTNFWSGTTNPTFPLSTIGVNSTNPGFNNTADVIANVHYKPTARDDFQFLYQNGVFSGLPNYAEAGGAVALVPCAGATGGAATSSNGSGGIAPDGKPCPLGLAYKTLPSGTGNYLGHYSGIGKIQWNRTIDAKSSLALRLAENFNEYIFDQPLSDPNLGSQQPIAGCPGYPYAGGSPVTVSASGGACTQDLGDYYQDRRSSEYFASADYTLTPTQNLVFKAGGGEEYDHQRRDVRYLNKFNAGPGSTAGSCYLSDASYPCANAYTDIPTHVTTAYVSATANLGALTLQPGLHYGRIFYGVPSADGGATSAGVFSPSLSGTARLDRKNALRFSYASSGQFIGTEFVYRLNSTTYDPAKNGTNAYQPTRNNVTDLQFEHSFDPNTSLKVGPYYRLSNNYLAIYSPFLGFDPTTGVVKYGDSTVSNATKIRSLGAEFGFSHLDPRPVGTSLWLSGSYNNYWTQVSSVTGGQSSFLNFPLPGQFLSQGIFVRGYQTPLLTATLTADLHSHGWHLLPLAYYAYDTFYNSGGCIPTNGKGGLLPYDASTPPADCGSISDAKPTLAPEGVGTGYWFLNATLEREFAKGFVVGINVENLTNIQHGPTPCYNAQDPTLAKGLGSGCALQNGPGSGTVAPVGYIYQNLVNAPQGNAPGYPRTFEGFIKVSL